MRIKERGKPISKAISKVCVEKYMEIIVKQRGKLYNCSMKEYYSLLSAAKIWEVPYIETVFGKNMYTETDTDSITVTRNNARYYINGKKVRSCELDLPPNAIILRNGKMVASPELMFLECASKLSIHRLILLGLQLCSHEPGKPYKSITTKERLEAFLANTSGHRGQRKALRAVKYVKNGSASIMESMMYMILTLPHALGGYGLDGADFNYKVDIKEEAKRSIGKNRCYLDLYYKQARLGIEYDSYAHHRSPLEQGNDNMRSAAIARQGIEIMKMNTIQLYNKESCRLFAKNLAARLKRRIYIRTKEFDKMHDLLRELLPVRERDAMSVN